MKRKLAGIVKGAPTGVLVSIGIHAAILVVGMVWVVVTVIKQPEVPPYQPYVSEVKKMDLIKPTVKVKHAPAPNPSKVLRTKTDLAMRDFSIPDVHGTGPGEGIEDIGMSLIPELSDISLIGNPESISVGNDFEGTFYSIAYSRGGEELDCNDTKWLSVVHDFLEAEWNPYVLAPYYKASQKVYTSQIFIPVCYSEYGPSSFGIPMGPDFMASYWIVHYKGKIKSPRDKATRFRFWGMGDDFLPITLSGGKETVYDNEMVADFSWVDWDGFVSDWKSAHSEDPKQQIKIGHHSYVYKGDWFTLEPDEEYEMNVLLGESWGGHFCCYLMVEEEGVSYEENRDGLPILPIFKVAELPAAVKDRIQYTLIRNEADLNSDLMFNVY